MSEAASDTTLNLEHIRIDGGTQSRAEINAEAVSEYAEAMRAGANLPPLVVFYDGAEYWLADGFHRYHAYILEAKWCASVDVRQGDRRAAILYSVGANAAHGLRRTNDDKRRAVLTLLNDSEWSQWPQGKIAQACGVTREYVNRVERVAPPCDRSQDTVRTVTRGGGEYQVNTANIGAPAVDRRPGPVPTVAPDTLPPAPEPATAEERARAEVGRLSFDAMVDEILGLRADLLDAKATVATLQKERDDFQAKWKEATAGDLGRALGNAQRRADTASGRMNEYMTTAKKLEFRLKKSEARVAELESMPVVPA